MSITRLDDWRRSDTDRAELDAARRERFEREAEAAIRAEIAYQRATMSWPRRIIVGFSDVIREWFAGTSGRA